MKTREELESRLPPHHNGNHLSIAAEIQIGCSWTSASC